MKKLFLIFLFISAESFAAECHLQRNPIGFKNYEVCEVTGTGYTCVTLEDKTNGGISCFPTQVKQDTTPRRGRFGSDY